VLVDVDHVVDLLARAILPLHAWEWVLALLVRRQRVSDGLAGYLALDQMTPPSVTSFFYWITFRALHRFRAQPPLIDPGRCARGARWMRPGPLDWF
jgi:hypothetical protein